MNKKIKVGLIFGGRSREHEVSLMSATSIQKNLDPNKYETILLGIDKQGTWHHVNTIKELAIVSKHSTDSISPDVISLCSTIDIFFPIIHGTFGEDGSLQGFFEILNKPYAGAGVLGSAISMDKGIMKQILQNSGISISKFVTLKDINFEKYLKEIISKLKFPIFVKPTNSGSSVGIFKAKNIDELKKAIKDAFQFDKKIIFEEYIKGRELECSVLGNENPQASEIGEVKTNHEFYSYEAKYIDDKGTELIIPANLDKHVKEMIQKLAIETYKILECSGFARVDFFLTEDNKIFVNEINTLPGFTSISMYPKLWEVSGKSYSNVLDDIISLGFEKKSQDLIKHTYV